MSVKNLRFVAATLAVLVGTSAALQSHAASVYDSIVSPDPYNLPSQGYQATSTAELGDHIQLGGTARDLTTIRVGMSNWAKKSTYLDVNDQPLAGFGHVTMDANGYQHPLTLNIYNVNTGGPVPTLGAPIASETVTAFIPWRPENGPGGTYVAGDGNTYNGIFTGVQFDFTADGVTLPDEFVVALAFNTNTYGADPILLNGPYESLNYALATTSPTVGADVSADQVFWNTSNAAFYTDGGAGGVGTLRVDTGWSPYTPAIEINAVPEPASLALAGAAALGLFVVRRRNAKA